MQLNALSVACPSAFNVALRCLPTMPRELNVVHTDCAGKPRQPTLLLIAKFAIPALYTEFVGRCTWLFSIHMRSDIFPLNVLSVPH